MRLQWDEFGLETAILVAKRSRCTKTQCGCVLMSADRAYMVVGYNGPAKLFRFDSDDPAATANATCDTFCERRMTNDTSSNYDTCPSIHAEINALLQADHSRLAGGTAYVSSVPCVTCAHALANSGVARVVMRDDRPDYRPSGPIVKLLHRDGIRSTFVMKNSVQADPGSV